MKNQSSMPYSQLLFSFKGRIPRSTYWLKFGLPYMGIIVLMYLLDAGAGTFNEEVGLGIFSGLFWLIAIYPSIAFAVKRVHDRDRSGWFLLLGIIPIVNIWLSIELGFLKGTSGSNKYGDDPIP